MYSERVRERMENLYSWVEPPRPLFIAALRLIELLNLLLKHVENVARRVAVLELGSQWVITDILLCAPFVRSQGIIEYKLEVGDRGGSSVSVRHKGGNRGVEGK